ncbi:heparinase II/III domain-containing protein [Minwuia thermotolerans]|uniref:Uncharacterized protein n=1 Tax=Minwuia thermotolerans TaxID=2056226 RepID=A0A2M9FYW6_9PROT|nr:heparinase II/III family protein [Minwuia thermotolerans]PJK28629.1 hypothetical protein CVT23_16065 [Minwuia thermotolerans]
MRNPLRQLWILVRAALVLAAAMPPAAAEPTRLAQTLLTRPDVVDDLTPGGGREMRPYPNDGAHPAQNPPSFRWRRGKTGDVYEVRIALESGEELVRFSSANLLTLKEPLPPGTHRWRLRRWPAFAAPLDWTGTRSFTIGPDIRRRSIENPADAYARAAERKRPRLLPGEPDRSLLIADAYIGWKRAFFDEVAARTGAPPLALPRNEAALGAGGVDQLSREELVAFRREIRGSVNRVMRLLHDGLIVWVVTRHLRDDRFGLDQALAAADWLTELDAFGATSNQAADLLNLRVAKALAVAYDIAHEELDGGQRRRMLTAIENRVQQTFDAYVVDDSRAIAAYPYNSHGYRHVLGILSIATVLAGDTPRARTWFEAAYPVFIGLGNPWGGDDGGYANGVNYGAWEVLNNLAYWDAIRSATGVDYFEAGWAREVSVFLNYVIPPGAPNSGFGDGAEDYRPYVWAETARMLFERTREPLAGHLYAGWRRLIREGELDASELQEEFASWTFLLGAGQPPAPIDTGGASARRLPGAAVFPSIGWAALHSDLADPDRYSILFKSSPYGSFSHSHADQNSFIINGRREPLAIDSGYYDTHKSRHHLAWTTRTEAHNAITFDGGKGQPWDDIGARGRLTRFTSCPGYDAIAGDATEAYAGQLAAAQRTIMYLRPDQVLVYDHLVSATPRRFEWNIHARRRMEPTADGGIRLAMDTGRVCIRQIAGPESGFGQTTDFPREPSKRLQPGWQPQWHGRYTVARPTTSADWLFLISLDCAEADVGEVAVTAGGYRVRIGDRIAHLGPSAELAVPAEGPADPGQCHAPPKRELIAGIREVDDDTSGPHPPAPDARSAIRRLRIGN